MTKIKVLIASLIVVAGLVPFISNAAIAFDTSTTGFDGTFNSSKTLTSAASAGTNLVGVVVMRITNNATTANSVTWGAVSCTRMGNRLLASTYMVDVFACPGIATGAQTVQVELAANSNDFTYILASYNGASQSVPTITGTDSNDPASVTLTTTADNSWLVMGAVRSGLAWSGQRTQLNNNTALYDSGPHSPAGGYTISTNSGANTVGAAFVLAPPAAPSTGPARRIKGIGINH